MSKDFNISMICLILNWFVYDPSWMLHLSEFVWTLHSSVWVVFNNFLLKDATDRSEISSDQKRLFFATSLYPLSFFANTPFNLSNNEKASSFSFLVNSTTFIPCLCSINMQLNTTEKLQEHVSFLQRKNKKVISIIFVLENGYFC